MDTVQVMARRIVATLERIDPTRAFLPAGLMWYSNARDFARTLAAGTPFSITQTAGVIAALSPRTTWRTNQNWSVKTVEEFVAHDGHLHYVPKVGTHTMRYKAWRILQGADVWDTLNGLKTRDFAATILGDDAPVIDGWAYFHAKGVKLARNQKITPREYRAIQEAFRLAGEWLGLPGYIVQAWGWCALRNSAE